MLVFGRTLRIFGHIQEHVFLNIPYVCPNFKQEDVATVHCYVIMYQMCWRGP